MRRSRGVAIVGLLIVGFLAGCDDPGGIGLMDPMLADPVDFGRAAPPSESPLDKYQCRLVRPAERGAQTLQVRALPLDRLGLEEAPGGKMLRYQYRTIDVSGRTRSVLMCDIPATAAAVASMNAILGVETITTQSCVEDGFCQLPPIIVNPPPGDPECDRYLTLGFSCDDGSCMFSVDMDGLVTRSGCEDGGGSGDQGGGGGTGNDSGGSTVAADLAYDEDHKDLPEPIDCSNPPPGLSHNDPYVKALLAACKAAVLPTSAQRLAINVALDQIALVSGCEAFAVDGRHYLSEGTLKVFPHSAGVFGSRSIGGYGGNQLLGIDVMISDIWIDNKFVQSRDQDGSEVALNLRFALVHELEHRRGRNHLPGTYYQLSTDTYRCSGVTK